MSAHDEAGRLAQTILDLRQRRLDHLPAELFGEPAWGLLLVLFVADTIGERLTAAEACRRVGGPINVAERWLTVLEQRGLAACKERCDDGHLTTLTPAGIEAVEVCMRDARSMMSGQPPVRHGV